jgi:hypothetical protein
MPSRIAGFLRNTAPNAYCERCLSTALRLDVKTVLRETAILANGKHFEHARRVCSYCGSIQNVIGAAPRSD